MAIAETGILYFSDVILKQHTIINLYYIGKNLMTTAVKSGIRLLASLLIG